MPFSLLQIFPQSDKMGKAKLTDKPKKPMSAYFLWMNEVGRADVKKKNPDASITDVSKACGAAWRSIDGAVKSKFEKKSEDAKKAYDKEYKTWLANGGEELLQQEKNAKKKGAKGKGGKAAPKKAAPKRGKKKAESSEEDDEEEEAEDSE